jgi:hypothetical protein
MQKLVGINSATLIEVKIHELGKYYGFDVYSIPVFESYDV